MIQWKVCILAHRWWSFFYINADDFSILRKHALKYVSLWKYLLLWIIFSKLNLAKSRLCTRLTDENIEMELGVATSLTSADVARLTKEKNFQPSH